MATFYSSSLVIESAVSASKRSNPLSYEGIDWQARILIQNQGQVKRTMQMSVNTIPAYQIQKFWNDLWVKMLAGLAFDILDGVSFGPGGAIRTV